MVLRVNGQKKPKYLKYLVCGSVLSLFLLVCLSSTRGMQWAQGSAHVVNYVGIMRSSAQRVVTQELVGRSHDGMVEQVDALFEELLTGRGTNQLIVLKDGAYLDELTAAQESWQEVKAAIDAVHGGASRQLLYDAGEDCYHQMSRAAQTAEQYAQQQVHRSKMVLSAVITVLVIALALNLIAGLRELTRRKQIRFLEQLAFTDSLTGLGNRAGWQRFLDRLPKQGESRDIAVIMFDINNLKPTNDLLGHQVGDLVLQHFAEIIGECARDVDFVGRYGGDEFVAILDNATQELVDLYLSSVAAKVKAYNATCTSDLEKLCYAVGYSMSRTTQVSIEKSFIEADQRMYDNKRRCKSEDAPNSLTRQVIA